MFSVALNSSPVEVLGVVDRRPPLHGRYLRAAAFPRPFVCLRNSPDFVHSSHRHFDCSSEEPEVPGCSSVVAASGSWDCIELDLADSHAYQGQVEQTTVLCGHLAKFYE